MPVELALTSVELEFLPLREIAPTRFVTHSQKAVPVRQLVDLFTRQDGDDDQSPQLPAGVE